MDIIAATLVAGIVGAIVGAVIVTIGTILVAREQIKRDDVREERRLQSAEAQRQRDLRERAGLIRRLLRMEIEFLDDLGDQLTVAAARDRSFNIVLLNGLNSARQGIDRNRDWLVLIEEQLRMPLFEWVHAHGTATSSALLVENFAFMLLSQGTNPLENQWVVSERQRLLVEFQNLSNRGRDLIARLSADDHP
jgi:hypothetical protein